MKVFWGEVIGTFTLVFIGCFSVAAAVLFHWLDALWQVALCWSFAVFLGIQVSKKWSQSHLNPAVTLALFSTSRLKGVQNITTYILGQFVGAMLAAIVLFVLVHSMDGFQTYDIHSAMIFGEFYPNPAIKAPMYLTTGEAVFAEAIGTAVLLLVIYEVSIWKINDNYLKPAIIGLTVGTIIMFVADFTQAGLNPARDLGPRVIAYLMGWQEVAFQQGSGTVLVYVLAPIVGGVLAAQLHQRLRKQPI